MEELPYQKTKHRLDETFEFFVVFEVQNCRLRTTCNRKDLKLAEIFEVSRNKGRVSSFHCRKTFWKTLIEEKLSVEEWQSSRSMEPNSPEKKRILVWQNWSKFPYFALLAFLLHRNILKTFQQKTVCIRLEYWLNVSAGITYIRRTGSAPKLFLSWLWKIWNCKTLQMVQEALVRIVFVTHVETDQFLKVHVN